MAEGVDRILDQLLAAPREPAPVADLVDWRARHRELGELAGEQPVDRAILAAAHMDRLAYVFASGYQEALRRLVPATTAAPSALCASEEGGAHPRAIRTRLEPAGEAWTLSGSKGFVTLGAQAEQLLVVASTGRDASGRNRLAVVQVPATRRGVVLEPQPPAPFVPELPHARARFVQVPVEASERLEGDGYTRYLKPFRTVEDIHIHAALLGYLHQVGRRAGWERAFREDLLALLVQARALALASPDSPGVHLALGGLITRTRGLVLGAPWDAVDEATRRRWERDVPLLDVAGRARGARLERAWERVGEG